MSNQAKHTITKRMIVRDVHDRWLLSQAQEHAIAGLPDDALVNAEIIDAPPFGRYLIRLVPVNDND